MKLSFVAVTAAFSSARIINGFQVGQAFARSIGSSRKCSTNESLLKTSRTMSSTASTPATPSTRTVLDLDPEYQAAYEQVIGTLRKSIESPSTLAMLEHFTGEYFATSNISFRAGNAAAAPDITPKRFMNFLQLGMTYGQGENKYTFGVTHTALRGKDPELEDGNTYDYYEFGCDFFRPAIDLANSVVHGKENLEKAFSQIEAGENVVFLANHQSEADPQVFTAMLESIGRGKEAADMRYIAGHKVTTDALAIPFSMGRNLICIHSKKHIDTDPETKPIKQKQNLAAMSAMLDFLKAGGASLWVAPSGGRDRRNVETGDVPIAPFDSKTIDMFRLMGNKSKVPTHYYSLAMVSYDLCPPPDTIEASVGEERNIRFVPVGVSCSPELENTGGVESRHLFSENAEIMCEERYRSLLAAIEDKNKSDN